MFVQTQALKSVKKCVTNQQPKLWPKRIKKKKKEEEEEERKKVNPIELPLALALHLIPGG